MAVLKYLTGYPEPLVAQVSELLAQGKLGPWLQQRYPTRTRCAAIGSCTTTPRS